MNKTAILNFIIDKVALKCRNVSTNMRKKIHWMLKYKKVTVREYDPRTLILNGWIRVRKEELQNPEPEEMKKGVSNYCLQTQERLDRLRTLNNEVRCNTLDFIPSDPIEVESVERLYIDQDNYEVYSKCSFNKINFLGLVKLSTDQTKSILTRFKRIDELEVQTNSLESIDLSQSGIKRFCFYNVSLKGAVYLPKEISKLSLINCKSPSLIKAGKVKQIDLNSEASDFKELTRTLKRVKVARINEAQAQYLTFLPSTVREIYSDFKWEIDDLSEINKHFPHLIKFESLIANKALIPMEALEKTKLRVIEPKMSQTEEKFTLRPRKIVANSENAIELNNHPELFEKVEVIEIYTDEFNFDVLPKEIKRIHCFNEINEESVTLNRLEEER